MARARATRGSIVFGLGVGVLVALFSYRWVTNPDRGAERGIEERAVRAARVQLVTLLGLPSVEYVDAINPARAVGKTYVYPLASGWEVSGYYRRDDRDAWHPYLATIGEDLGVQALRVGDAAPAIRVRAVTDTRIEVLR